MGTLRASILLAALGAVTYGCDSPVSTGGFVDPDASVAQDVVADDAASKDVAPPEDLGSPAEDVTTDTPAASDVPAPMDLPAADVPVVDDVAPQDVVSPPADVPPADTGPRCGPSQMLCGDVCVETQTDGMNCGACGRACPAGQRCDQGLCIALCAAPTTFCRGMCVATSTSVTDCGACGNACSAGANATATCAAGVCGIACADGFGDCDGNAANGCETNVRESAANCGRCGVACPGGSMGVCAMGACSTRCMPGQTLCGASCADILTSQEHCGACGNNCRAAPNATGMCSFGLCRLTCATGFGDCDMNPANGCETDTRASATSCGACGTACAAPSGGTASCAMGRCVEVCPAGRTACGGACVDTQTDNNHCGRCGNVCGTFSRCGGGSCSVPVLPTRYTQGTSPQTFLDACNASGRVTYLPNVDDSYATVQLPFAFRYWATDMAAGASINITSNGWIGMLGTPDASLSGSIPSTGTPNGVIAAYWGDNRTRSPGICVATMGTAPNRQWVVEWLSAYHYGGGGETLTFEVVLSETTRTIDLIYQTMSGASSGRVVGIENQGGTEGLGGCAGGAYNCAPSAGYRVRFTPAP